MKKGLVRGWRERKESFRNIHQKLHFFFHFKEKISSIKKENELIHFYRLSSIHASTVSIYKGILCLTLLGRRFREGLGIWLSVEFYPVNELLSYLPFLNWAFLSSERRCTCKTRTLKEIKTKKKRYAFYKCLS